MEQDQELAVSVSVLVWCCFKFYDARDCAKSCSYDGISVVNVGPNEMKIQDVSFVAFYFM